MNIGRPFGTGGFSCVVGRVNEKAHVSATDVVNALDGMKLESIDYWTLIIVSDTEPVIRIICESTSHAETERLIGSSRRLIETLVEDSQ